MAYDRFVIIDNEDGRPADVTSDGKLRVDTELTLSGDVTIENVKVASTDGGALRYLRVDGSRNLYTVAPSGVLTAISGDVSILDISKGTQTNDVKITMDSEPITIGAITAPVGISGDVNVDVEISDVITIGKVTAPLGISGDVNVTATDLDIRDLALTDVITVGKITAPVGISGDVNVAVEISDVLTVGKVTAPIGISGDVNVTATDLDIRDLVIDDVVTIGKITAPVGISGDVNVAVEISDVLTVGKITAPIGISGDVSIDDGGNIITVDATDLDIRDLALADVVTVGAVTVPLGISGDVSIQDGGNTITVDATDLDIRDLVIDDVITVGKVTAPIGISGDVTLGTGSNAIGKLATNTGVDIGDVDITSISSGDNVIGRVYVQGGVSPLFNESQDFTTAQGSTTLCTPESGKRILLKGVAFTTGTAGSMYLHDGGKKITPTMQFATNGNEVISDPLGIYQSSSGDVVIYYSSDITGNHGVTIWGIEN